MWLETGSTLRQQIRDEFRRCRTPQGCVEDGEREDEAGGDEGSRERRENLTRGQVSAAAGLVDGKRN